MKFLILALLALVLHGQTFEAASVRIDNSGKSSMTADAGRLTYSAVTLRDCLKAAYDLRDYQLEGPGTIDTDRFDIVASAGRAVVPEEMRLMLQSLLAERFGVRVHRETREIPVFLLEQGKNKPKFQESAKTDVLTPEKRFQFLGGSLVFEGVTMQEFAERLNATKPERPIVDRTGLTDRYDIRLELFDKPEDVKKSMREGEWGATLVAAVQTQLGLKIESFKASMEIVVVDRAERLPAAN